MSTQRTPRQIAREETLARIKDHALRQLADGGADALSLRAIARELGIVSSAIYRYYASRDELLTALILDAYGDLADALSSTRTGREAWIRLGQALRAWALAQPHRFSLIYGSAIPGYRAPETTIEPAASVIAAFAAPAAGAHADSAPLAPTLHSQLTATAAAIDLATDAPTTLWLVRAWSALIGAITLELNGQFVGGFDPADDLYAAILEREADAVAW